MSFVTVKVNTNPIPASVLAPKAYGFPSGGGGGGGSVTVVKIAPVGAVIADALGFVGGPYPQGSNDLATIGMNLLGGKKLLVLGNFPIVISDAPGAGYTISGKYTLAGIQNGAPFGAVDYTVNGGFGFSALTGSLIGPIPVGIRLTHNLAWTKPANPTVPATIQILSGNISAMEFDVIP